MSTSVTPGSADGLVARAEAELAISSSPDSLRSNATAYARGLLMHMIEHLVSHLLSQVLLGRPHDALVTVAQLEVLDLPFHDGNDVRALAHLALGETRPRLRSSDVSPRAPPWACSQASPMTPCCCWRPLHSIRAMRTLPPRRRLRPHAGHPWSVAPSRPTARHRRRARRRPRRALRTGQPARTHGCDPAR